MDGTYSSSHCRELRLGAGVPEAQEDDRIVGNQDLFLCIKGSHLWIWCQVHIRNFIFLWIGHMWLCNVTTQAPKTCLGKDLEAVPFQMETVSTSSSGLGLWSSKFQHNFCFVVGTGFYDLSELLCHDSGWKGVASVWTGILPLSL